METMKTFQRASRLMLSFTAAAAVTGSALFLLVSRRTQKFRWWLCQRYLKLLLVKSDLLDVRAEQLLVGGVDISFVKDSETEACAALVVMDASTLAVVHERYHHISLTAPYIPGYLAFREVDSLLSLVQELRRESPAMVPQIILVDGNGILHPNGLGLASHFGLLSGIPTIGIGKKLHHVDGLNKQTIAKLCAPSSCLLCARGDHAPLVGNSGVVWGALLRTTDPTEGGFKPIVVSVGHGVCLDSALALVKRCTLKRIPEPVRQADLRSREWLRRHTQTTRKHADA
jgi:deoxyinosine 3'endonuclease (endonuclease V)